MFSVLTVPEKVLKYSFAAITPFICCGAVAGEPIDRLIPFEGAKVFIENTRGDVKVTGWDKAEIQIRGVLDDLSEGIEVKVSPEKAYIRVENPMLGTHGDGSDLEIQIPRGSKTILKGVDTDFNVEGVHGGLKVVSVGGDIDLEDIHYKLILKTVSGDVDVEKSSGYADMHSVNGDLNLAGDFSVAKIHSMSGDVEIEVNTLKTLDVSTVSGNASMTGVVPADAEFNLKSVSGNIELEVGEELDAKCYFSTRFGGTIVNKFNSDVVKEDGAFKKSLSFIAGAGGGKISAKTVTGTIYIDGKDIGS